MNLIDNKMTHRFQYWYSYFDFKITTNSSALDYLSIIQELPISSLKGKVWPSYPGLEPMCKIFQNLQEFLISSDSWSSDSCTTDDLKAICQKLNNFYLILLIQKSYCFNLWQKDKRRVQASICHYYFLLQQLIGAIIPSQLTSISECRRKKRLCLVLHRFQKTINKSLNYFEQIYNFMCSEPFISERSLTNQFFQLLGSYLSNIVTLQVSNKMKIPKLYEHILTVTIAQIACKEQKKSKVQIEKYNFDIFEGKIVRSFRERSSTFHHNRWLSPKKRLNKSLQNIKKTISQQQYYKLPKVFDFSKKIKKKMLIRDPILIIDIQNIPIEHTENYSMGIQHNSMASQPSTECESSGILRNQIRVRRQSFVIELQSTTTLRKRKQLQQAYRILDELAVVQQTQYLQRNRWKQGPSIQQRQQLFTPMLRQRYTQRSKSINLKTGSSKKNEEKTMALLKTKIQKLLKEQ